MGSSGEGGVKHGKKKHLFLAGNNLSILCSSTLYVERCSSRAGADDKLSASQPSITLPLFHCPRRHALAVKLYTMGVALVCSLVVYIWYSHYITYWSTIGVSGLASCSVTSELKHAALAPSHR